VEANQSFLANVAILEEKMAREAWYRSFWAGFAGIVKVSTETDENGNIIKNFTPSGMPIEILNSPLEVGRDNMLIPLLKSLTGEPVYGDGLVSGTGGEQGLYWLRAYVNAISKAVIKESGTMSTLRTKLYRLYEKAKPQLVDYFAKVENMNVFRTFYEGLSANLSAGENDDGLGLVTRYHPNWYYISSVTAPALTAVGTEKYFKTAANLDTAVSALSTTGYWTKKALYAARVKAMELKIAPCLTKDNKAFWPLIMSPHSLNKLKADSTFVAEMNSAYTSKMREHPGLSGIVAFSEGFAIFEDLVGVRAWDTTNDNLFGTTFATATEPPSSTLTASNLNAIVFGRQAIVKGVASSLRFTQEESNHKKVVEIAGEVVNGYNRNDFVDNDDAGESSGDAFYKRNATATVSSALAAVNQSSMIIMSDDV
jgi:hypothetical protein